MPPKRKPTGAQPGPNKRPRFTQFQNARNIATQTSGKAFSNGEMDVDKFVKAREYEIRALEQGMKNARKTLMSRAFQSVPRELRRRTASHNVKKVPKRLQARAKREMVEDNTPTVSSKTRKPSGHMRLRLEKATQRMRESVKSKARKESKRALALRDTSKPVKGRTPHVKKNSLAKPPKPKARFRRRQIDKTWLPTHMFHTKRAHMTPPKEPLWRMAIPLSPTQKCYRPTHRAGSARGAMAWDTSYLSTIGLTGTEAALTAMLKGLGVGSDPSEPGWWEGTRAKRCVAGCRSWNGWVYEPHGRPTRSIAPVTIIWDRQTPIENTNDKMKPPKRQIFVRVHPSAFLQLWQVVLKLSRQQKPLVVVEDLRFEIGSIDIMGPSSTEALIGVLRPTPPGAETDADPNAAANVWGHLKGVSNPSTVPSGVLLGFEVTDPRLHYPHRTLDMNLSPSEQAELLQTLTVWPIDKSMAQATIFDRACRTLASRLLPSQKSINRRKGSAAPGSYAAALPSDPRIPVLALPCKSYRAGGQGTWTVLLPRKCVLPVWYCLIHYPLSLGGNIQFGGLQQTRQLAYEAGVPWFPGDYPGTMAGQDWEQQEQAKRKKDWEKRPKSKRVAWESVDLGRDRRGEVGQGWACDWSVLRKPSSGDETKIELHQVDAREARRMLSRSAEEGPKPENVLLLAAVEITMLGKGVSTACARVYRLPTNNDELRAQWVAMAGSLAKPVKDKQRDRRSARQQLDMSGHARRQQLAKSLLSEPRGLGQQHHAEGPVVPDETDLVGFVTTGNFNLSEGAGTSIGSVDVEKLVGAGEGQEQSLCIVRESGQGFGRLARWKLAP